MSGELARWYRGRLVRGPFTPFDPAECRILERETGLLLPPAYRSFLEAAGGGRLEYSVLLPACEPEPVQEFGDLFHLGRDRAGAYGWGTLLGEYRASRGGRLAASVCLTGLLPIARNGGGDTLFLDLNPSAHGELHAFVRPIACTGYLGRAVFTKVADGFDAYLDGLFIDPGLAQDIWGDVRGGDASDPCRHVVEEWLDKDLPGWRAEPWASAMR
ncbi:SMI1/KNR4 family protein [Streptomyces clavuligerus]|uniref:SMI1/KNR4 family protein n=1 Tax=Streptomyces clavuligerus TaxID=1901 RepID=UPI001EE65889|nr:SMI1/KNR4 family protein [Streptomyces clavuligerus]WDN56036.1 SMI1/KNR4 family protein [Streptomyces clavuligerus]